MRNRWPYLRYWEKCSARVSVYLLVCSIIRTQKCLLNSPIRLKVLQQLKSVLTQLKRSRKPLRVRSLCNPEVDVTDATMDNRNSFPSRTNPSSHFRWFVELNGTRSLFWRNGSTHVTIRRFVDSTFVRTLLLRFDLTRGPRQWGRWSERLSKIVTPSRQPS